MIGEKNFPLIIGVRLIEFPLTLTPQDRPYGPMSNIVKINFSGGKVQNIVNVLMKVFFNS